MLGQKKYNMQRIDYIGSGRMAGCPFCSALTAKNFNPEERIRLLSGSCAGKHATIVEPPENFRNDPNIIIVQIDEDGQQMINLSFEIVERLPSAPVPSWAPPISIRKTNKLHEQIIGFCKKSAPSSFRNIDMTSLYMLIWYIWDNRLPLEPKEVWHILEAHGVPKDYRNRITNILKHGLSLLIAVFGKKPIKKFRVEPMSVTISPKYGFSE
jgi:hypothetical protein